MTFEVWDLIPEQERLSNEKEQWLSMRNPRQKWHQLFSTLLEKLSHLRAIQWTLKRKNKQYSAQLGGKIRSLNEESVNGGQCVSKKDNQWTSTFRSHRGQYCSKTFHDLVNSSSNWKQRCTWRTSLYLHLRLPSETWLWLWQMLSHNCIWMNVKKMHTTKTNCGTIYFGAERRTSLYEYGL